MSDPQTMTLQPGQQVRDLQINAVLGSGAFGITYLVTDPALGRQYALKEYFPAAHVQRDADGRVMPNDAAAGRQFTAGLRQFLAEARAVAALDHPNIVKVYRYFEANGTAYALLSYTPGEPLDRVLQTGGALGPEEARKLLLALLDGLDYLHAQGLVHQDVKPANIHISATGEPVLLDLGAAVAAADRPASQAGLGSAGYAAPEQSEGGGQIGPWTDIYGLAATLYRCITGQIPPAAADRQAALSAGEPDPLPAISTVLPDKSYGGISDAIELGLNLGPQDRPRDIRHWRDAFKSLDWRRSVVGAEQPAPPSESREWLPLTLLAVFVLTIAALGIWLLTADGPGPQSVSTAPASGAGQPGPGPEARTPPASAEETDRWQAALQADTVAAYRRFLADYPDSIYRKQAELQLAVLDDKHWRELAAEDTVMAYEQYLDTFPSGLHQTEAMVRIDAIRQAEARAERERLERQRQEQLAWEKASNERTIAAFDQYIGDWPAGLHIEEAQRIRRLLKDQAEDDGAFATTQNLNTREAYQAYIDAFPGGAHITAALQQLDTLTLRPGKVFRDCAACPVLTVVPAGAFWQGSDDSSELALAIEKPRRLVTIDTPFAVGVHEVTIAEWDACFQAGACTTQADDNGWGRGQRPVIMVSWNDAQEYVHWLSEETGQRYRLPSESEWEYSARAGAEGDWPGADAALICQYGNIAGAETGFQWQHRACADDLALGTTPVGAFRANAFGLYDVIGNVAEWTADCLNLSYVDAPVDGSAWGRGICSSHMTRGGSWLTGSKEIRLPARFNLKNGDRNDFTGFRVVREVDE